MNIRESASTDSRVVATARAGDSFTVSQSQRGDTWCWLNIGAGWIAKTSRVSSTERAIRSTSQRKPPQQSVQQQSDIDNCCYVDRQCDTDEEWVSGFWAFQRNNQCAAPSQQRQQGRQQRQHNGNQQQSRQQQQSPQEQQESKKEDPSEKEPSGDLIFIRLTEEEWREARCDIFGGSSCD